MIAGLSLTAGPRAVAQQDRPSPPSPPIRAPEVAVRTEPPATKFFYPTGPAMYVPLPTAPSGFDTSQHKIRVGTVVNGLSRPYGLAFLPDGRMLVSERTGQLRVIQNGMLDPKPISSVPEVESRSYQGLMDLALHPTFAENRLLYIGVGDAILHFAARRALSRHIICGRPN